MDLAHVGTPGLSWRRLRVLIEHLPQESALTIKIHGKEALWGLPEHLLAAIIDVMQWANYQRGGGKGTKPKPLPRPGSRDGREQKKIGGNVAYSPAEIDAIFSASATGEEVNDGGGARDRLREPRPVGEGDQ